MRGLPGQVRVTHALGEAESQRDLTGGFRALPGVEQDLAPQGERARLVLHRPGPARLLEHPLGVLEGPRGITGDQQGLAQVGVQVERPAPPVRSEGELVHALVRLFHQGQRPARIPQVQLVEGQVDQRADLHVGVPGHTPDLGGLPVVLGGATEVPDLLVEPAERVAETAHHERVVAVARLGQALVDRGERLDVLPEADLAEAEEGARDHLGEAVVDLPRGRDGPAAGLDGLGELTPPVGVGAEPREVRRHRVPVAVGPRDRQRLLEQTVAFRGIAVRLGGQPEVGEAAGEQVLIPGLPADRERLLGGAPALLDTLVAEGEELGVGHLDHRFPLAHPVPDLARHLAHPLELGDGVRVAGEHAQRVPPVMVDLDDPGRGQGRAHLRARLERARVEVQGGRQRVGRLGPVPRADQVGERLLPVASVLEMVGELLRVVGEAVGVDLLDGEPHRAVQLPASLLEQALVGHVLDEGVLEDVGRLGRQRELVDDLELLELGQELGEPLGEPGHPLEEPAEELTPDDRRELHGPLAVLAEPVQARHDDALDGVGHVQGARAFRDPIAIALAPQDPEVEQGLGDLLDEQGHAVRLLQQGRAEGGRQLGRPEQVPGHGDRVRLGERVQGDQGVEAAGGHRRRVAHPVGQDQHERHAHHRVGHGGEVLLGARVAPVQVLEHQHQRPQARPAERQGAKGLEALLAARARLHVEDGAVARIHREQVADVGNVGLELAHPAHPVLDLGDDLRLAVQLLDAEVQAQLIDEG